MRKRGEQTCESGCNLWESGHESIRTTTDRTVSDPAWREAPRSIFSSELGERLVEDPTFHRGGYLQLFCIENGDKKVVEG